MDLPLFTRAAKPLVVMSGGWLRPPEKLTSASRLIEILRKEKRSCLGCTAGRGCGTLNFYCRLALRVLFVFFVHKICAWFLLVRFFSLHETRTIFSNFPPRRYGITMDDLKDFRQLDSITPGHPENFATPGVEVSTGPLGQGISNAVGMAIAERHLAATFNKPDCKVGLDFCRKLRF